jgi:hypothetical protein
MAPSTPDLHIPPSAATVDVCIINTTGHIDGIPTNDFLLPSIPGHKYLVCPVYSFLIQHSSGRKVLFDLGVRKDWENFAPGLYNRLRDYGWNIAVEKDVREILDGENIDPNEISSIIWRLVTANHHFSLLPYPQTTRSVAD